MASFSSDVYKSTAETPADTTYQPYADLLKKRAKAAVSWEGSPTGVAPQTSLADDLKAEKVYRSGEYARREKAAGQQADLAKAEDVRTGTVADRVKQALFDRQQATQNLTTQQSQMERTAAQQAREAQQGFGQTIAEQDYKAFTNATQRYDAIQDAYAKGIAEFQLLDAARNNALQMADLGRYYTIMTNDIKNQISHMQAMSDADLKLAIAKIDAQAKGGADIISGLFKIAGIAVTDYFSGS